jgi:prevent-host-death family protein
VQGGSAHGGGSSKQVERVVSPSKKGALRWQHDYNDQYDQHDQYDSGGSFMRQSISAVEARQKLGEILNRVALRGEEIIIERAGKKIARLLPIENKASSPRGKLDFRKAAGLGKEIWKDIDVDAYLRRERDEWI